MQATSLADVGSMRTIITNGGAHPPEQWAEIAITRVMQVADTAPQPIRDQAYAFRNGVRDVIAHYMRLLLRDHEAHLVEKLRAAGMHDAAALVMNKET